LAGKRASKRTCCGRTKLDVYSLAHGAQKHCGARLDIPLDSADNRLAEVAKQKACSAEELEDSVKTVALRWGRASCLSEDPLKRAIKKLVETQEDRSDTIRGLDALVKLGAKMLKKLGEMLGDALEKAPRVEKTGEGSFASCIPPPRANGRLRWRWCRSAAPTPALPTTMAGLPSSLLPRMATQGRCGRWCRSAAPHTLRGFLLFEAPAPSASASSRLRRLRVLLLPTCAATSGTARCVLSPSSSSPPAAPLHGHTSTADNDGWTPVFIAAQNGHSRLHCCPE
jgi:hypothetical protein